MGLEPSIRNPREGSGFLGMCKHGFAVEVNLTHNTMVQQKMVLRIHLGAKNRGKTPKMDGENNGKPYEQMDDLGGKTTLIFGSTPTCRWVPGVRLFFDV